MNQPSPVSRRLEQLLQNLEDGCISGPDHAELMDLLRGDSDARQAYRAHMHFVSLLHTKAESFAELPSPPVESRGKGPRKRLVYLVMAAAAALVLGTWMAATFIPSEVPGASIQAGPNTGWAFTHGGFDLDGHFLPGTVLEVTGGMVDVRLDSGTRLLVEGPAEVRIESPDEIRLPFGRLWVQAESELFTVHTRRLRIVDLGTEFGVAASDTIDEEVHVARGRVRVTPLAEDLAPLELTAGQACRADPAGKLRTAPFISDAFHSKLPEGGPYIHWSFDEVDNGAFPSTSVGLAPARMTLHSMDKPRQALEIAPGAGRFGGALTIDDPARFARADFPGIAGDVPRTVTFWVKGRPRPIDHDTLLVGWGLPTEFGTKWKLSTNPRGNSIGTVWGGSWTSSRVAPPAGTILDGSWHHLAFVFTGQSRDDGRPEIIHYVDGVALDIRHTTASQPVNTECTARYSRPLTIGMHLISEPSRDTFQGSIDELYVFRGALRDYQIRSLFQHNSPHESP